MQNFFFDKIAQVLNIKNWQVSNTVELLNEGATIPFISRYRKEKTGNLDEVQVEEIKKKYQYFIDLQKRKEFILSSIKEQDKLTKELEDSITNSWDEKFIEDIYAPFKSRKKTKADIAIENGLEPLAKILISQKGFSFTNIAENYIGKNVLSTEEAVQGAKDIAAQWISEKIIVKDKLRKLFWNKALISSKLVKGKEVEAEKFQDYFDFSESIKYIKSHRFLAIVRGDSDGFLKYKIEPSKQDAIDTISSVVLKPNGDFEEELVDVMADAYQRLLKPSIASEVFNELKDRADEEAITVFADNLKQLLLQPPLGSQRILALDPGYRTGCKVVCLDANGNLLHNETIFPHPPQKEIAVAKKKIASLVEQYKIDSIAIGNGTAGRETEFFIKGIHFDRTVKVFVVNEAGASVYSASKEAREEFPQYDVTVRGAISIGRRLMDPLAELVKIDPKSIGVGQYQHDVSQKALQEKLDAVVISCVNNVGVELNTASKFLLQYVSGIGPTLAQNIIDYRTKVGTFQSRKELMEVPKLGAKAFEQAAGFLRVRSSQNPLDNSSVHPERYSLVNKMCKTLKSEIKDIIGNEELIAKINPDEFITDEIGAATLNDILLELKKPGRDPRKMVKVFEFSKEIKSIDDLKVGMELPGIVNNVTNFGAFVDLGIKENGLIHISNLSDSFVSNPAEIIKLHQHVNCEIISIDKERKRIGLKLLSK
jgi:protein Tex